MSAETKTQSESQSEPQPKRESVVRDVRYPHPMRVRRKSYLEKLPEGVKLVARPSRWGNPYKVIGCDGGYRVQIGKDEDDRSELFEGVEQANKCAVAWFRDYMMYTEHGRAMCARARHELRGKKLACYCSLDVPCHADVLAEIANWEEVQEQTPSVGCADTSPVRTVEAEEKTCFAGDSQSMAPGESMGGLSKMEWMVGKVLPALIGRGHTELAIGRINKTHGFANPPSSMVVRLADQEVAERAVMIADLAITACRDWVGEEENTGETPVPSVDEIGGRDG